MYLHPRHFVSFLDGRLGAVQPIAFVPGEFCARIGARSPQLLVGLEYARKLKLKHALRYEDFELIQETVDDGWALLDARGDGGRRELVFLYEDGRRAFGSWRLVVKAAAGGSEIWLKTFHRIQPEQLRNHLKRLETLRDHRE